MKIFCTHLNAEQICKEQFPYLTVYGQLVCELDEKTLKEINLNLN